MRSIRLSYPACALLGLVPYGMVRAEVYGLDRLRRQGHGWVFSVVEPWRLEVAAETVRRCLGDLPTPSVGLALYRALWRGVDILG